MRLALVAVSLGLALGCGGGTAAELAPTPPAGSDSVLKFDFQNDTGPVAAGYTKVTPATVYARGGFGFVTAPPDATDGSNHTWNVFGKTVTVQQAIPGSVLSDATVDSVGGGPRSRQAATDFVFKTDVEPGDYDVTIWLGDVTTPRHQVRATINGVVVDVERMDVNNRRGHFDQTIFGSAVPRTVRVSAPDGFIEVTVGAHPDGANPIEWTYEQDEDPNNPPSTRTAVLVPAFSAASLQALTLHPAADPPLARVGGDLAQVAAPDEPGLDAALALFNAGDMAGARAAFDALADPKTRACGLFWVAGHPAQIDEEVVLLETAAALLAPEAPRDHAAADLLLQVRLALDAERYRRLYGYTSSGAPATDNLGRSCALVEQFQPDHPYVLKGTILWLRNRGGLDPRRVTASWERAQWLARQLEPNWGTVNPYVHLYATDEWKNEGKPWQVTDWAAAAGPGPDWARSLMANMNGWLDLFEWWSIHRQSPEGDIGGGWTDDVEVVPAFGLMAYVLEGASDITREATVRFADGIWNSNIIDRARGYQAQYADVEHTAEPTGNILHLHPLVRFGDPEGLERIMISARTFRDFFLTDTSLGHSHFQGNHLSATQIAINPDHRADIPLCGRVTNPFPFLLWYANNPGIEAPLRAWIEAWVADAARTDNRKPIGVFPQAVWTPTDGIGYPGTGDWWSANATHGQFGAFPKYQHYLYNLAAWCFLRTGEAQFREPLDKVQEYTQAWVDAGRPAAAGSPPVGEEEVWCGANLQTIAQGAMTNAKIGSGMADWDSYIARFGETYGRFLLAPTDATPIRDIEPLATELYAKWPYRTTEGVMTDRLLVVGWAQVISYYIGAEVFSVFFGMPVHAVTWQNTTRLFAAAVTKASQSEIEATLFLFADEGRDVTVRLWQLEPGATYRLEGGPAPGLGRPASIVDQGVPFTYEHLGQGVTFTLPARSTYALKIRRTAAAPGPPAARADLAVAPRDVSYARGQLTMRVHNVGAADATGIIVTAYEGTDTSGAVIGTANLAALEAPTDLVPRFADLTLAHTPGALPAAVTVVIDQQFEVTPANNTATAWIGGASPDLPPPMLTSLEPATVAAGGQLTIEGRNFVPGTTALAGEAPTTLFTAMFVDAEQLALQVDASTPPGTYLISVAGPDGKRSNLLPLAVTD
ncbi:MAG: IPT/TIG domain-containing protein [Planctomycetota bacterium]